jgi:hypothetical protein
MLAASARSFTSGCPPTVRGRAAPAPLNRRCGRRRLHIVSRTSSETGNFAELRSTAADAVARAQEKLSALERARRTAEQAKVPAAQAEQHWQELHSRLSQLQHDAHDAMAQLRKGVTSVAGGEAAATQHMLEHHVRYRLQEYHANSNLAHTRDWKVTVIVGAGLRLYWEVWHGTDGGRCLVDLECRWHLCTPACLHACMPACLLSPFA